MRRTSGCLFLSLLRLAFFLGVALLAIPAQAQNFAYVTGYSANTVSVIDTATNTVVATVAVGIGPYGVAITPDGTRAYVVNFGVSTVSVIDTANNTLVAIVPVGFYPQMVAVSPDGTRAYVTNVDGYVSEIDTATNTVTATITSSDLIFADGVAITPDGTRAYVTLSSNRTDSVLVIDLATNTVVSTIVAGNDPLGVAITPDGSRAYVTNLSDSTLSVIDTASNAVIDTVTLAGPPFGVAITPDGTRAYVAVNDPCVCRHGSVGVIDTATNTVIAEVPVRNLPLGVAIRPDGTRAYVSNGASVSVIDTASNTVVATIAGGSGGWVAITPGIATRTTLKSSLNPSIYGQKVTFAATVTGAGLQPPTGTVAFTWSDGFRTFTIGTAMLNSSGVATLTKSNLNADPYPMTAVYKGDAHHLTSKSAVLNQIVVQTTSAATISSSQNPSTHGQPATFTATITSPTVIPTGPVTFSAGKTVMGTAQLAGGKAQFTTSTLSLVSTTITATYYGDSNIAMSSASVIQEVK